MGIIVNLDIMMARRKMSLSELAGKVDLTLANLSILKNGHARAIRFSTLEALCRALDCQPGDLLAFEPDLPGDGDGDGDGAGSGRAGSDGTRSGAGADTD